MSLYPSYKDSGVEWVGEIPQEWLFAPLKYYFDFTKGVNGQKLTKSYIDEHLGEYPVYSGMTQNEGVLGLVDEYEFDYNFPIVFTTTVGAKSMTTKLLNGRFSLSQNCLIMIRKKSCEPSFVQYFLSYDFLYHKILLPTILQPSLRMEDLDTYRIALPPLPEQRQIVTFLDSKTQKIDNLIELTEQKIELLKEQRTALINKCVTKGLNPNVEMKDSGVEWIGEIPSNWVMTKLKFVGEVVIGLSYKPENLVEEGKGTLVMRSSNVQNGKPSFSDNVYVNCEISEKLTTKEGDILICSRNGSRNLIGKNCVITKEIAGMTFGVFMTIFRSKYWDYIYWVLNSPIFKSQSGLFLTSTINQLTVSTLQNFVIPFPRIRIEKQNIVEYLYAKTQKIDSTIEKESQRIELLKEYRQALISEVVTGKIDVRGWDG